MKSKFLLSFLLVFCFSFGSQAQKKKEAADDYWLNAKSLSGLKFRNIGPALTSGRVADIAVNPNNFNEYVVNHSFFPFPISHMYINHVIVSSLFF